MSKHWTQKHNSNQYNTKTKIDINSVDKTVDKACRFQGNTDLKTATSVQCVVRVVMYV